MSTMRPTVDLAKIQIPTGYEKLQRDAAMKRKLADAMLSQGLTPERGMNNYAQVLGKLAQTWVGKSLGKEATNAEVSMQNQLRQDYITARDSLMQDVNSGISPQAIIQKYGSNPVLRDDLKPFEDAFSTGLRERENLINFGGRSGVRQGDVMGRANNDPSSMVMMGDDGTTSLNPVAVTAAAIGQGNLAPPVGDFQTVGQMPGVSTVAQAMAGAPSQQPSAPKSLSDERIMNFSDVQRFTQSLAPQGLQNLLAGSTVAVQTPEEAEQLPTGTRLRFPDGTYGWAQ